MVNGKRVRVFAIYIHCKQTFSTKSSGCTGHLLRHIDTCAAKEEKEQSGRIRSVLKYNPVGSLMMLLYLSYHHILIVILLPSLTLISIF
jgi:predicted amidophosphoribosyltransferase